MDTMYYRKLDSKHFSKQNHKLIIDPIKALLCCIIRCFIFRNYEKVTIGQQVFYFNTLQRLVESSLPIHNYSTTNEFARVCVCVGGGGDTLVCDTLHLRINSLFCKRSVHLQKHFKLINNIKQF